METQNSTIATQVSRGTSFSNFRAPNHLLGHNADGMALVHVIPGAEEGRGGGMARASFPALPGAPDDGMAQFGSSPGLPGGGGMARASR